MEYGWERGDVIVADGAPVATAIRSWFSERAELDIGSEQWTFRAVGSWLSRRRLAASVEGIELLRAVPSGFWQTTWTVDGDGPSLTLAPRGLVFTHPVLLRDGVQIGELRAAHVFTNRHEMTTTTPLAPEVAAFLLWVAYVDRRRRANDGGGAST